MSSNLENQSKFRNEAKILVEQQKHITRKERGKGTGETSQIQHNKKKKAEMQHTKQEEGIGSLGCYGSASVCICGSSNNICRSTIVVLVFVCVILEGSSSVSWEWICDEENGDCEWLAWVPLEPVYKLDD